MQTESSDVFTTWFRRRRRPGKRQVPGHESYGAFFPSGLPFISVRFWRFSTLWRRFSPAFSATSTCRSPPQPRQAMGAIRSDRVKVRRVTCGVSLTILSAPPVFGFVAPRSHDLRGNGIERFFRFLRQCQSVLVADSVGQLVAGQHQQLLEIAPPHRARRGFEPARIALTPVNAWARHGTVDSDRMSYTFRIQICRSGVCAG